MTAEPQPVRPRPLVLAFPRPGRLVEHAYAELDLAMEGTPAQRRALGDVSLLPRPWNPSSCVNADLRAQVWTWLEQVVAWLNHEYVWAGDTMVPACWPRHPHLVQEIAALADQRRHAERALTGDATEEWHRYALPAFLDRMRQRLGPHGCAAGHDPWPAAGGFTRWSNAEADRSTWFDADVTALLAPTPPAEASASVRGRLRLVDDQWIDSETGEIVD